MEQSYNKNTSKTRLTLRQRILELQPKNFESLALDIFQYQAVENPVYNEYISYRKIKPGLVSELKDIPFLPIQFFKSQEITSGKPPEPVAIFESSGTTGVNTSRHFLHDPLLYEAVSERIFEEHYGSLKKFHILALLPSYLERNNSSLVYMMKHFIALSGSEHSGFYLNNVSELLDTLAFLKNNPDGKQILLLGVTFALLDLAEYQHNDLFKDMPQLVVMDTGGMKGRRREMLREEVHDILCDSFSVAKIHSEYGMTELLSQGYSSGDGLFTPGFSMRVLLRDIYDPFSTWPPDSTHKKTGGINVIDLANLDTCAFIETQDLARFGSETNSFSVMGRFDNSDIRGCNLMII